jgi:hypothetical protein
MLPDVTDDVVGHHGFDAVGEIPGHSQPPVGIRGEQGAVDRDREAFFVHDVLDSAQSELPPLRNSRGIEWRHIKLDAWRR